MPDNCIKSEEDDWQLEETGFEVECGRRIKSLRRRWRMYLQHCREYQAMLAYWTYCPRGIFFLSLNVHVSTICKVLWNIMQCYPYGILFKSFFLLKCQNENISLCNFLFEWRWTVLLVLLTFKTSKYEEVSIRSQWSQFCKSHSAVRIYGIIYHEVVFEDIGS